jgi:RHS repeat-associated protein
MGSSVVNGYTVPTALSLNNREGTQPTEYAASESIEFLPGFESASGDAFTALIADGTYAGSSGTGSGSISVAMSGYRYGFNGKENDNEVKGEGNQQDYGMRVYDPRVGKFLSVDPLTPKYPMLTPYQFSSNRPIDCIDLDGLEAFKKDNNSY